MMFSKKTTLPARPGIPTVEEIISDLGDLDSDDPFFRVGLGASGDSAKQISPFEVLKTISKDDLESPNKAYEKVKAFIDVYKILDDQLVHIDSQCERLKSAGEMLHSQVQGVKNALEEKDDGPESQNDTN